MLGEMFPLLFCSDTSLRLARRILLSFHIYRYILWKFQACVALFSSKTLLSWLEILLKFLLFAFINRRWLFILPNLPQNSFLLGINLVHIDGQCWLQFLQVGPNGFQGLSWILIVSIYCQVCFLLSHDYNSKVR